MTDTAKLMEELIADGLTAKQIGLVMRLVTASIAEATAAPTETPDERKKRISRETSARHRVSRNVTSASPNKPVTNVTECHETSPGDTNASPLAHVEDNPSRLVNPCDHTGLSASECASDIDWPESGRPSRAYLDRLESELRSAAGESLNLASPNLLKLSPILALGREGQGPRCDLQADVLPTIRAVAARTPKDRITTWDYFRSAILSSRDQRLAGAGAAEVIDLASRPRGPPSQGSAWAQELDVYRQAADNLAKKYEAEGAN